ncbi:MAG: type II toxin-antitoxin system RelE/ParE family toxin [Pantoea sp.]|nr:type II toxin-antitoxin system RelE/ParE family toxin [Pantoea sp.]
MWIVILSQRFDNWLSEQENALQEKILADLGKLKVYGPDLPRPYADTVKSSHYKNMKELRVQFSGKPVRAFYEFDPVRQAIVLCAGDKSNDKRFYDKMIRIADDEFSAHLAQLQKESKK